jgi:hypothetical protein
MANLDIECLIEVVVGSDRGWQLIWDVTDGSGACVCSTCVLSGDSILIEGVAFVASKFPDLEEMCPAFGCDFLAPGSAGLNLWASPISVALFSVVDDGLGDAALQKMLLSNRLLMSRLAMKWVVPRIRAGSGWLPEPLNDALGNEHAKWLCSVARVAEVVQGDGQELLSVCVSGWMGTGKDMLVFFLHSGAVASVILLLVVAVDAVSSGKPAVDALHGRSAPSRSAVEQVWSIGVWLGGAPSSRRQ